MDYFDGSDDESDTEISYALHNAAEAGNKDLLSDILAKASADTDFNPELPRGRAEEVDINERDDQDCTPLHIALLSGHLDCAKELLQAGASVRLPCEGSPPLGLAVCVGAHRAREDFALQAVQLLLRFGASPYERDDNGRTALHWAASLGLVQIISALLQFSEARQAPPEQPPPELPSLLEMQDKQGNTPLHIAASSMQVQACKALLCAPRGATIAAATNKAAQTPLHVAAAAGSWLIAALLVEANFDAGGQPDRYGRSAAQWAAFRGHQALAAALNQNSKLPAGDVADFVAKQSPTLIVAPPACREHHTAPAPLVRGADVPPENVNRLRVLTDPDEGILRTTEFAAISWDEMNRPAALVDILRVHEWAYVRRLQVVCSSIPIDPSKIARLDPDTALSRGTWNAALAAAGAVCHAVDSVISGQSRNAFCAIRPPGHHAGPLGTVTSANDPHGSQGFCFFSNIAIAGAYAVNVHRHKGIRRVALLDFDVHHGNGTQACVARVVPQTVQYTTNTPLTEGSLRLQSFHPWLDGDDADAILFASVQGYGHKTVDGSGWVYPGSGATCDTRLAEAAHAQQDQVSSSAITHGADGAALDVPPDDPDVEFAPVDGEHPPATGPRVINVGIPGPGSEVGLWRRAWRDKILPAVADFKPDLIIVSAGFDAHRKDDLNFRYIGITERDYYWLTQQLVSVANKVCQGRLVSALEGGYRIQGGVVSAFSRSVAAHVRALQEDNNLEWNTEVAKQERGMELRHKRQQLAAKRAKAEARALQQEKEAAQLEERRLAALQAAPQDLPPGTPGNGGNPAIYAPADSADHCLSQDRKRRRRAPVDYAALDLKLAEEARDVKLATE